MGKNRLYLLIIVGMLLPFFFPDVRDILVQWDAQTGASVRARAYADAARPATIALIRFAQSQVGTARTGAVPANDDLRLKNGSMTLTSEQAEAILKEYNSPAAGYGYAFVQGSQRTGIDNAWVMAMFIHESTAGTAEGWAGRKADGTYTANTGNLIYAPGYENYGRFADFHGDWAAGINAHFDLLNDYAEGRAPSGKRHDDIVSALNEWAPPSDGNNQNLDDPGSYPNAVLNDVRAWRNVSQERFVADGPKGLLKLFEPFVKAPDGAVASVAYNLTREGGSNVMSAYNSSPALRETTIAPGADWSFNENWVIDHSTLSTTSNGIYGGGVCDYAARFSNAAHKLGLKTEYSDHGFLKDVPPEDYTSIWSGGGRGGQDLIIKNDTSKTVHLQTVIEGDNLVVKGWLE